MRKFTGGFCLMFFLFSACIDKQDSHVVAFDVYCEMVANNAKPLALHYPMDGEIVSDVWESFEAIAQKYEVELFREDDFPNTLLFPSDLTEGKSVILIYKGDRLKQYSQLKADVLDNDGNNFDESVAIARRFGRLLGYGSQGINDLLIKNSAYYNVMAAGVKKQITHLYYKDPEHAKLFYKDKLGLAQKSDDTFQISEDAFIQINPLNDQHQKGQVKSTAIAFLTDQLEEWYAHVQEQGIQIKYTYKPREGGPHDGFVAVDPEGYLLEFEQFKQHPENELFIAKLATLNRVDVSMKNLNFYGSITWAYHKDVLKLQNFYEQVLGFEMVADQGWTKIYQTSKTGFIGLVDEKRGMEDYADKKAVEIQWQLSDQAKLTEFASKYWKQYDFEGKSFSGPEQYRFQLGE